ncbi:hypothetical protein AAMO2058_000961200 [Amorphochlora amoebiformis]
MQLNRPGVSTAAAGGASSRFPDLYDSVIRHVVGRARTHMQNEGREEEEIDRILGKMQRLWKTKIRTSGALNESRPGIVLGMPEAQTMDAKSYGVPVYSALQVPMVPPAPSVPLAPKAEASSSLTRKRNHVESKSAPPEKKARVVNDVADELTLDVSDEDEDEDEDEDDLGPELEEDEYAAPDTKNNMLCYFDKVSTKRGVWKCNFSLGILNINGKDYLAKEASGEFSF